jgi:hypothetical protein
MEYLGKFWRGWANKTFNGNIKIRTMTRKISFTFYLFIAFVNFSLGQINTCTDISFPTNESSLYQGVYYSDLKWNKKVISVSFHNGTSYLQQKVKQYAKIWSDHSGIEFEFVNNFDADIRVGFYQNKGSWSLIGRQSNDFSVDANTGKSVSGKNGISMNFGWFDNSTPEEEFKRTITHEFGHALGLLHEHMHPNSGIKWNYSRVYAHYLQTQNWSKEQVDRNVFQKYSVSQTNGIYDASSIMHYPIPKDFTIDGYEVGLNTNLSNGDKNVVSKLYPKNPEPTTIKTKSPHRITDLYFGDGVWALIMSKKNNYGAEVWRTRIFFPEKEIQDLWNQGYMITNLTYGNGLWALVMKKGTQYTDQIWRRRSNFPESDIKEFYNKGYTITNLTYGANVWTLVMSKTKGSSNQVWRTKTNFPEKDIQELWNKGYKITTLEYCNDRWVLVMDLYSPFTVQVWRTRNYFPKDEIEDLWKKGYYITRLTYGQGIWSLVMSQGSDYYYQSWRTRTYFPEKEIDELWKE